MHFHIFSCGLHNVEIDDQSYTRRLGASKVAYGEIKFGFG
jgi:hypothetical protein